MREVKACTLSISTDWYCLRKFVEKLYQLYKLFKKTFMWLVGKGYVDWFPHLLRDTLVFGPRPIKHNVVWLHALTNMLMEQIQYLSDNVLSKGMDQVQNVIAKLTLRSNRVLTQYLTIWGTNYRRCQLVNRTIKYKSRLNS